VLKSINDQRSEYIEKKIYLELISEELHYRKSTQFDVIIQNDLLKLFIVEWKHHFYTR
jgi:hypothetical protein